MSGLRAAVGESRASARLILFQRPVPYSVAWALQQQYHAERRSGTRADTLLLLEHLPVYTAGRGTRPAHLKPQGASPANPAVPVETANRGGSVTYHGPGQLVAYPILALARYAWGAKDYVHMLEEVLIRTLLYWDVRGFRLPKMPGIWVRDRHGEAKIASIGARIDRGITLHGFALNVTNDLSPFSRIIPCGLDGCRMTSLSEIKGAPTSVSAVAAQLSEEFSTVFRLEWTDRTFDGLQAAAGSTQSVLEREIADGHVLAP
jgi:lipoyl(octanoyl) transferase